MCTLQRAGCIHFFTTIISKQYSSWSISAHLYEKPNMKIIATKFSREIYLKDYYLEIAVAKSMTMSIHSHLLQKEYRNVFVG